MKEKFFKFYAIFSIAGIVFYIVNLIWGEDPRDGKMGFFINILGLSCMVLNLLLSVTCLKNYKKSRYRDIYFAGGCFWGTEKYFKLLDGVVETEVGYANGNTEDPTYEQVYTDTTGYAECVHVRFDSEVTTVRRLTEMYFKAIDPTSLNQQGEDKGTRYRTGVYYVDPDRQGVGSVLKQVFDEQSRIYGKLAVELMPLKNFVRAEDYHQDYLDKNPGGYCHLSPEIFEYARRQGK